MPPWQLTNKITKYLNTTYRCKNPVYAEIINVQHRFPSQKIPNKVISKINVFSISCVTTIYNKSLKYIMS